MSDEARYRSADELRGELNKVFRGPVRCPACGTDEWRKFDDVLVVSAARQHGPVEEAAANIPTLLYLCGNCGFVRMHAVEPE